jgi:hypothetical protein
MIRPDDAVEALVDAGVIPNGQRDRALSILRDDGKAVPDLLAWLVQTNFWMCAEVDNSKVRREWGGDLRQLTITLDPILEEMNFISDVRDWERALDLAIENIREETEKDLDRLEEHRARRIAGPRERVLVYILGPLLHMDGVSRRSANFSLLAKLDPKAAADVLTDMSEAHAHELRPDALEPLLTHADLEVRKAGFSLLDRTGTTMGSATPAAKAR